MAPTSFPSESDLNRIRRAVQAAEGRTSGEIVPYVVARSDSYEVAEWRAAALSGVLVLGAFAGVRAATATWLPLNVVGLAGVALLAVLGAALLTHFLPVLQRLFAGRHLMDLRVRQRATQAFVSEEVFATQGRTGVLIFVSLLERQVLVMSDSGIYAKVRPSDWELVVNLVVSAVREGRLVEGLVAAIAECGRLLEEHGARRAADDRDELADNLRFGS